MTSRTIDESGRDELKPRRLVDEPVEYLIIMRAKLTAEQAAEFEDCEELIVRHPKQPALFRALVISAEVVK
jgi:hypothetical protein